MGQDTCYTLLSGARRGTKAGKDTPQGAKLVPSRDPKPRVEERGLKLQRASGFLRPLAPDQIRGHRPTFPQGFRPS